jgi:hypothetical protein
MQCMFNWGEGGVRIINPLVCLTIMSVPQQLVKGKSIEHMAYASILEATRHTHFMPSHIPSVSSTHCCHCPW